MFLRIVNGQYLISIQSNLLLCSLKLLLTTHDINKAIVVGIHNKFDARPTPIGLGL